MSYNGIGLGSARGSGTSGYVQQSLAKDEDLKVKATHYEKRKVEKKKKRNLERESKNRHYRIEAKMEIIDHNRNREVELKCIELRDELEEQGVEEEEIATKVDELKASLKQKRFNVSSKNNKKEVELSKMGRSVENKSCYVYKPRFKETNDARR
ncbi:RNA splicing factor [Scheffersomyces stipitis CBS 6054]|uniref:Pre-mRNA-splicing factor CWC21 n=1 Tax=Scheffersomyces stipitis (strain ATCC 58785 / CBS 6054 / NBRC 10063 / NRRL Y-11545) TaxID=322104 RepID=A3LPL7_PICST|nr:RNA splicing factor [Scheffersomyces stipitis CBS 6054]ABN65061.1 RNA splicing factor [Scheffersomyces stipitis CBS 6054]KAG2736895.1 hypothetical protein G9P44_000985 [Scheffersomyces stipitis]